MGRVYSVKGIEGVTEKKKKVMARKKGCIMRKTDHVFFILFPTQPIKTLWKSTSYVVYSHIMTGVRKALLHL